MLHTQYCFDLKWHNLSSFYHILSVTPLSFSPMCVWCRSSYICVITVQAQTLQFHLFVVFNYRKYKIFFELLCVIILFIYYSLIKTIRFRTKIYVKMAINCHLIDVVFKVVRKLFLIEFLSFVFKIVGKWSRER